VIALSEQGKLRQYQETIRKIIAAFQGVDFPIVVESTLGVEVEVFDTDDQHDKALLSDLTIIADTLLNIYFAQPIDRKLYHQITGRQPTNFRPNEVGIALECVFPEQAMKMVTNKQIRSIRSVRHLKAHGYPDAEITDIWNRITYMEIKATTRPDIGSARDFFFTPLSATSRKVTKSARHLLLGFILEEEIEAHCFRTVGWKLVDLSRIKLSLKPEFNANNLEIYKQEAILCERNLRRAEKSIQVNCNEA